jgi:hypothetical protein
MRRPIRIAWMPKTKFPLRCLLSAVSVFNSLKDCDMDTHESVNRQAKRWSGHKQVLSR